jgi:hypothetical protein
MEIFNISSIKNRFNEEKKGEENEKAEIILTQIVVVVNLN